jgi:hypothetical protein
VDVVGEEFAGAGGWLDVGGGGENAWATQEGAVCGGDAVGSSWGKAE